MDQAGNSKILFILNSGAGNKSTDWQAEIGTYFAALSNTIEVLTLGKDCSVAPVNEKINSFSPTLVVAVGGDGTVKLVAECVFEKNILLGILPGGSANGLAKELGIPMEPQAALQILVTGNIKKIHLIRVNEHLCIHLSDIGFNAFVIKKFEAQSGRGMWGYLKASIKVLFQNRMMDVDIQINGTNKRVNAAMIVIANGNSYGSGALINPIGKLDDNLFEVIAVKKISLRELFKMLVSHQPYDPKKIAIYQTGCLNMKSVKRAYFQVDGEYLGKINEVKAVLLPNALQIVVPGL
ncbi:MAG: diacylglycerol kinase family lipid kinase [Ferruginibacter sp.]|nr:diacylglycerol kinase family lipid kinase [Ferruginibacter sp.]